jgi:hypothetical protein
MEGIYINTDDNGNEHYYFNASHIKTGSIDGGLINGIGLNIVDDLTGDSIFHVYKDENGTHIDMIANNLYIGEKPASTIEYVKNSITTSEQNTYSHIASSIETSESTTKEYIDSNIQTSETTTKEYVDTNIANVKQESGEYTDTITGNVEASLLEFINESHGDLEEACNGYADTKITSLKEYTDEKFVDYDTAIKEYIDTQDVETNAILSTQITNINQQLSNKAEASDLTNLTTRVATIEPKVVPSAIVSTVRTSTDYQND